MRADAESSCSESRTDSWHHWLGSLCGQGRWKDLEIIVGDLRHQLRGVLRRQVDRPELIDADRSLLGAIAAALPRSTLQPRPGGWSCPRHAVALAPAPHRPPDTATQAHSDRRARPFDLSRDSPHSHCASQGRQSNLGISPRPGRTVAGLGQTASLDRPLSSRSSRTPESTRHPLAAKGHLGSGSSCGPRPPSPATSPPSTPSRCAGSTCCSSSTSLPEPWYFGDYIDG